MRFKLIAISIIFLVAYQHVLAQKTIVLNDSTSSLPLSQFAEVFRDPTQEMGFLEVQKQKFTPVNAPSFQYAFSKDVFWFKFQIDNQSLLNQNNWYLVWSDALKDHVDLYLQQPDGSVQVQYGGMLASPAQKQYQGPLPVFHLGLLPKNQLSTYYLRLQADESIVGQLTLMTHQVYVNKVSQESAPIWIEIGIQLLRVLYNIILALYIRNASFRWYTFHTVVVTLSVLGSMGLIGAYLSDIPWLAKVLNSGFYQLMPATYTLFIYSLLNVPRHFPRLRWVFLAVVGLSVGQVLATFGLPRVYLLQFNNYLFLFTEALLIGTTLYAIAKRIVFNRYLLIPCFITLVPFLFLNLQALGVINYAWTYPLIYFTNFIEIVALSLVLGKIIEAAEQEKLRTEKALLTEKLEAEKLHELDAVKTQFFTNISHEFRTPLTLILNPIDDLMKKYPHETLLRSMKRNAQSLLTLINQLLDLSKLESKQMTPNASKVELVSYFRLLTSAYSSLAESRQIRFRCEQNQPECWGSIDTEKVEMLVNNLLSNAFKFTEKGGEVEVKVEYNEAAFGDGRLLLRVRDTGIGIASDTLPKIFDRFYQVEGSMNRRFEGTGIGLALVKELVEVMQGTIRVESAVERGTTFFVELPLGSCSEEADESTLPSIQPAAVMKIADDEPLIPAQQSADTDNIVLIVDDNADIRAYIRSIFEQEYKTIEAVNGVEGLQKAFEQIPDLIVSDLMMPEMDGFEFCQSLKSDERTSHIPIIMLTAKADIESRIEGLELGADDYLTKPFHKEELVVRVKNLIVQRELLRRKYEKQIVDLKPSEIILPSIDEKFIKKAYQVIEAHLSESAFSIEQLAQEMNVSSVVLRRKIKALTGQSSTQFVRKYRLHKAANRLRNDTDTVSAIAFEVGFESLSYFTKVFQEEFGQSPSEYRK